MNDQIKKLPQVKQVLHWGPHHSERFSSPDTMFVQAGRKIYLLGDIDGNFRPRSNPYDLHTFGKPLPSDPLAEKLQGLWAQPVKGLASFSYKIHIDGSSQRLEHAEIFTQAYAVAEFIYQRETLQMTRRDFAAQDLPMLFSSLNLVNNGAATLNLNLEFEAEFDLQDAWFTQLAAHRNQGQTIKIEQNRLAGSAHAAPERWAVVIGSQPPPQNIQTDHNHTGQMYFSIHLEPGCQETITIGIVIESQNGMPAAHAILDAYLANHVEILEEKITLYERLLVDGPRLVTPDPDLNTAFDLARANLQMLEADTALGHYFYAGLEIFPFWFSNDGAYSLPGILASGFRAAGLAHTRIGLDHIGSGRIPHQISPSGQVAFTGNAQETPLWVLSAWDAYRWTGDKDILSAVYPAAANGIFNYVLGEIDPDTDGYPSGPGMVEVDGMGAEKLDSAAYTWAALRVLALMAHGMSDEANARRAQELAAGIAARFDADWWDEESGAYAMSLQEPGNVRYPFPHWAIVVPLEVGLATPAHARITFDTLRRDYLNCWGLKHTVGEDERVWTLPTITLSRAAYRYGENELGEAMLRHVAETLQAGPIGLFHELIPEGACIIQLWSAATFVRGVIEDMFGLDVNAAEHRLRVSPHLPASWPGVSIEGLRFGCHTIGVQIQEDRICIHHKHGSAPLLIEISFPSGRNVSTTINAKKQIWLEDK